MTRGMQVEGRRTAKSSITQRSLALTLRAISIGLAFIAMMFSKRIIDPDGTSYLAIAKAYVRHDWSSALNSYWSPLYSWLLAGPTVLFRPGIRWQLFLPHLISFLSFLAMIAAWEWLLREYQKVAGPPDNPLLITLASYLTLAWVGLKLNGMTFTSGDIIVTVLLLLCSGLLLRIRRDGSDYLSFFCLGLILGFGFLTKAAVMTVVPVIIFVAAFIISRKVQRLGTRRGFSAELRALAKSLLSPKILLTTATALCVIAPFVVCLSAQKGRFTLSSSGPVNYSWQVTGMSVEGYKEEVQWPGPAAIHPFKLLLNDPRVLSFEDHPIGWYPIHFDPAWWCEGYPARFKPGRQLRILRGNVLYCLSLFMRCPALWLASLGWCVGQKAMTKPLHTLWIVWAPALVIIGSYCLVYVLPRYLAGPFALLGFTCITCCWHVRFKEAEAKIGALVLTSLSVALLWNLAYTMPSRYFGLRARHEMPWEFHNVQLAESMAARGLRAGDRVAYIGNPLSAAWVELDDATIIAFLGSRISHNDSVLGRPLKFEFDKLDAFWHSGPEVQQRVLNAFRSTGARWVVADEVPPWADVSGWEIAGANGNLRYSDLPFTYCKRLF